MKTLGLWTRKVVGRFEWDLMGHPTRVMEHNAENNLNCKSPVQEIYGEEFSDLEMILGIFWQKI